MLRFLGWRLLFEICNVKRLFGHGPDQILYFAFGANLSQVVLAKRRITPLATKPFTLNDYGLRFDHPAPWENCAYASAEYAPGESLHGFLYTLSGRDAARMDFYESVPMLKRYRRTFVEQDGVILYYYQTNRSTPNLNPSAKYLEYIVDGLETHPEVSPEYHKQLAAIETAEPGKLVISFLSDQSANRTTQLGYLIDGYKRVTLNIFLRVISRISLTEWFIRSGIRG